MSRRHALWALGAFGSSLVLHGICYASLAGVPRAPKKDTRVSVVSFDVPAPKAEPPPPPAPEPAAEPEPEPLRARPQPARNVPLAPTPAAEPPKAAETPPAAALDLTGVTLTNEAGGFAMPTGNGAARSGPIGPGNGKAAPALAATAPAKTAPFSGPPLVALADLSVRPSAPSLESALLAHYPAEARQRGLSGTASVRARIDADGVVRKVEVLAEAGPGFGDACRKTVQGSRWGAPKDREGRSVATEIRYTCRFLVNR